MAAVGRGPQAVANLKELEPQTRTRLREFMIAARTLIEGDRAGSLAAVKRILASDFSDPEGLFYLSRHLAHLNEADAALATFRRVVSGGYVCHPAIAHDPWLDPLRKKREFKDLLETVRAGHERAAKAFEASNGRELL
jgi:hypothetical protein